MAIGCALERLLKDLSAAGRVLSAPAADPEQPYAPPKSLTSADFRHLQEISKKTPAGAKRSFKRANSLAGRHLNQGLSAAAIPSSQSSVHASSVEVRACSRKTIPLRRSRSSNSSGKPVSSAIA